jgi:hypothetical protein
MISDMCILIFIKPSLDSTEEKVRGFSVSHYTVKLDEVEHKKKSHAFLCSAVRQQAPLA